jgi:anti-sigma regulatory factor (Ser/Thr protein kinase)
VAGEQALTIALEIGSRLDQVRLVRAALTGVLDHLRVAESDIIALELAVTEIVNNAVEHGYEGAEDQQIKVRVEVRGSLVEVVITDHASPFPESERYRLVQDLDPIEDADESWTPRGHGLQIVRQIVDSLSLECNANENTLTLQKTVALRD